MKQINCASPLPTPRCPSQLSSNSNTSLRRLLCSMTRLDTNWSNSSCSNTVCSKDKNPGCSSSCLVYEFWLVFAKTSQWLTLAPHPCQALQYPFIPGASPFPSTTEVLCGSPGLPQKLACCSRLIDLALSGCRCVLLAFGRLRQIYEERRMFFFKYWNEQ